MTSLINKYKPCSCNALSSIYMLFVCLSVCLLLFRLILYTWGINDSKYLDIWGNHGKKREFGIYLILHEQSQKYINLQIRVFSHLFMWEFSLIILVLMVERHWCSRCKYLTDVVTHYIDLVECKWEVNLPWTLKTHSHKNLNRFVYDWNLILNICVK